MRCASLLKRYRSASVRCVARTAAAELSHKSSRMQPLRRGHIPGFLKLISEVNNGFEELNSGRLVSLELDGAVLGHTRPEFAARLLQFGDVFCMHGAALTLVPGLDDLEMRSAAVGRVLTALRTAGELTGWRDELYPVAPAFGAPPALLVERAAAPHLGMRAYGVHVNGYVRDAARGTLKLWVARRSATKQTWPGKLDHIVAGGQPHGLTCAANVIKECAEEAGVPAELAAAAVPAGLVSYVSLQPEGLKPDVLFVYDLELPADFVPSPQDGEVEEFMLWDVEAVAEVLSSGDAYKPNCGLVIIDFFVRHGFISPDEPGYVDLVAALRQGAPR